MTVRSDGQQFLGLSPEIHKSRLGAAFNRRLSGVVNEPTRIQMLRDLTTRLAGSRIEFVYGRAVGSDRVTLGYIAPDQLSGLPMAWLQVDFERSGLYYDQNHRVPLEALTLADTTRTDRGEAAWRYIVHRTAARHMESMLAAEFDAASQDDRVIIERHLAEEMVAFSCLAELARYDAGRESRHIGVLLNSIEIHLESLRLGEQLPGNPRRPRRRAELADLLNICNGGRPRPTAWSQIHDRDWLAEVTKDTVRALPPESGGHLL